MFHRIDFPSCLTHNFIVLPFRFISQPAAGKIGFVVPTKCILLFIIWIPQPRVRWSFVYFPLRLYNGWSTTVPKNPVFNHQAIVNQLLRWLFSIVTNLIFDLRSPVRHSVHLSFTPAFCIQTSSHPCEVYTQKCRFSPLSFRIFPFN